MGRIKSKMIKNAAREMLAKNNTFSASFENNKKLLRDTMPSKSTRNKIAGHIARLIKAKQTATI